MANSEFREHFGNITPANFAKITTQWFQLDPYFKLPKELLARAETLTHLQGAVKTFIEQHRQDVEPLKKSNRHFEALTLINKRLLYAERIFLGDDLTTAGIFILRRRGYIKGHLATFGEFSKYPLGDSMRTSVSAGAAIDYMQADLKLGCVTDYAARVSECFGGAQMHELQYAAAVKLLGNDVTIMGATSVDALVVKDLVRRAVKTTNIGSVPGGGEIKIITYPIPDTRAN